MGASHFRKTAAELLRRFPEVVEPLRDGRLCISSIVARGAGEPEGARNSRFVPAAVRRAVWLRDEGRCQYRLENGELCGSTHRLQFDHVRPIALGGSSTVENVRLLCSGHNLLAARHAFGDAVMDRYAPVRTSDAMAPPR